MKESDNLKEISVVTNILKANDRIAHELRQGFYKSGIFVINIMGSPGAGKTSFLEAIIPYLIDNDLKVGVICGDIATTNDAKRISKNNIPMVQIMTEAFGSSCHLDATMIHTALGQMNLDGLDILFIENVGNLVCPSVFDIGEHARMVVLSVTEGEDKPRKYPNIFQKADCVIVSKVDLLPYLKIDKDEIYKNLRWVNPKNEIIDFSYNDKIYLDKWMSWYKKFIKV
jgi:hydrogenase nickel incorporation protein HypB